MERKRIVKIAVIALIGIAARFWVSQRGYNADFVSWQTVANIANSGGNVYAETRYYNYGPVWVNCLHLFVNISHLFPANHDIIFRWMLVGFLALADVGIFVILCQRFSLGIASIFFLNPISVIITGYHNQFDNVAIFLGLCAVILIGDDSVPPFVTKRKLLGLALLGCSLMTKHIFFFFPAWIAVKQKTRLAKLLSLSLPVIIFLLGFLPYWSTGKAGILRNVFHYSSAAFPVFYDLFLPDIIKIFFTSMHVWLFLLVFFAFFCKPTSEIESLLFYTGVFFMASPSTAIQYLVIPLPLVARYYKNVFFITYLIFGASLLLIEPAELHYTIPILMTISGRRYAEIIITALILGVLWEFFAPHARKIYRKITEEIAEQLTASSKQ